MVSITTLLKNIDAGLLFTDTDSLTYGKKSEDVMKNFLNTNTCLTLDIFQKTLSFLIIKSKWNGCWQNENRYKGKPIDKFVGLKSKMHSMLSDGGKESNTAKGVNITTKFKEYEDTLINKKVIRHKIRRIQSEKYKIRTYGINKISLLCLADKRFVLDNGIHTLAYFHKD